MCNEGITQLTHTLSKRQIIVKATVVNLAGLTISSSLGYK